MDRGVSLKSQYAVTSEFGLPAKGTSTFLADALKKAMIEAEAKFISPGALSGVGLRAILASMPSPWPFGTVVRSKGLASWESHRLMVVTDNGHSFTGLLLTGTVDTPTGTRIDTLHANWEPDS